MGENLFNKLWKLHETGTLDSGQSQLFVGLHLIHEVTSPQAFSMLKERGLRVMYPGRTFATADHIVPTINSHRPFEDPIAEEMMQTLENNTAAHGITLFGFGSTAQGIVHVIGPELGLTQPGMTIACGDSHTSTHGAFGSISFGIGTSQVRDVLATQTIAMNKPMVRRITVTGEFQKGVSAKDLILHIIGRLGVKGGAGYAYEFAGSTIERLSMDERMTICNMCIEGGARFGYINPDKTTYDYIRGRKYAPKDFDAAVRYWKSVASDPDAEYDDEAEFDAAETEPVTTWGIHPGQAVGVTGTLPEIGGLPEEERESARLAYDYMGFSEGQKVAGTKIDVVFIGSCTNGRITDLREAAETVRGEKTAPGVRALVVPGSAHVKRMAEEEGLDRVFTDAGFEWREPGCSMCLAMNPDKLSGRQICASTSNRNYIGRQGSPAGRTLLMSPAMAAAAAVNGEVVDVRNS